MDGPRNRTNTSAMPLPTARTISPEDAEDLAAKAWPHFGDANASQQVMKVLRFTPQRRIVAVLANSLPFTHNSQINGCGGSRSLWKGFAPHAPRMENLAISLLAANVAVVQAFPCSCPLVQQHKLPRRAVLMPNARRSTLCLIDDYAAFAKESVDCREDRVLAGPDLSLTESHAQRTSSHAKSFCVFQCNYGRIHNTVFRAYDQADPFG
jgi:hypothetical protein